MDNNMTADMLSKIALQISHYFKMAHESAQMNKAIMAYENGQWANILLYQSIYFEASAWLVLAVHRFKQAKEQGKDMGVAAGTAIQAQLLFQNAGPIVALIPDTYKAHYKAKLE